MVPLYFLLSMILLFGALLYIAGARRPSLALVTQLALAHGLEPCAVATLQYLLNLEQPLARQVVQRVATPLNLLERGEEDAHVLLRACDGATRGG